MRLRPAPGGRRLPALSGSASPEASSPSGRRHRLVLLESSQLSSPKAIIDAHVFHVAIEGLCAARWCRPSSRARNSQQPRVAQVARGGREDNRAPRVARPGPGSRPSNFGDLELVSVPSSPCCTYSSLSARAAAHSEFPLVGTATLRPPRIWSSERPVRLRQWGEAAAAKAGALPSRGCPNIYSLK